MGNYNGGECGYEKTRGGSTLLKDEPSSGMLVNNALAAVSRYTQNLCREQEQRES